jgi:glycosyltransferase involved in cell wall biosynthesis
MISKSPITIITINYNNSSGLLKTANSVLKQSNKNFDWVIIDGASNDDSINNFLLYIDNFIFNNIKIISERDCGIYDAMNKGINNSNSEYFIFIRYADNDGI